MGTVHFYSILALFLLCYFDGGNEVLARKKKCTDACDETVNTNINLHDVDSYEDDEIGTRDLSEKTLLSRINGLKKEIQSLLKTQKDVQKALIKCLDRDKQKINNIQVPMFVLCEITPEGCGDLDSEYVDSNSEIEPESDRQKYYNELEKRKKELEKQIKKLKDSLGECEEKHTKTSKSTPTTTPEPTTTTPKPKQKKFIIRTKKVSWNEAVRLCTNELKQIATITSQSDQDALGQARKVQGVPEDQLWVGGRRNSPGEQFFWKGQNPAAFTYTNWHSTEPSHWSDDDQNCVESSWEANQYMWFVYECDTEYNYACEYY